ncbi:nicotinamide mononucleotide transporter family protein [Humibacter ginsenosidimutans]|uniref:Nicotinamide mononucleotide transporter n=1 Tax=Humibacter ginsenosidimutans TaxID=2599293 RepID=A0A5B8M7N2_9MICO|nr:nicotinamide mononucleotide transporter family protein [Humibacter ginsenosidimutans]QDZ15675.1 nicotinamide mononucleotide transporter [Humibacter ginsenosidimutans]
MHANTSDWLGAFDWLNTQFSLFGLPVYWSDFIGNVLALATVVLALKRWVVAWPVQILGSVFLLIASLNVHLLGNAGRQVIIIVVAGWGWAMWGRNKHDQGEVQVRWASWRMRAVLIAGMLVGTALVTLLLKATNLSFYPGAPWWLVACDAWIFVGTLIAMVAQGRRWVEFWFVWIAVDVVGVPLAVHSGLYFSGIVYGIFFVLVLIGIRDWVKRSRTVEAMS